MVKDRNPNESELKSQKQSELLHSSQAPGGNGSYIHLLSEAADKCSLSGFWTLLLVIYEIKTNTLMVLKKQPSSYLKLRDQDQRETNTFKKYLKTKMILFITFQKHYDLCDGNGVYGVL